MTLINVIEETIYDTVVIEETEHDANVIDENYNALYIYTLYTNVCC